MNKKIFTSYQILIFSLFIFCIATGLWFFQELSRSYHNGMLPRHSKHYIITPNVIIPDIQPWMTFEYINKVFKLPPEYLRGKMSIQDASYPRMTLMGYAKRHQLNAAQFVNSVKDAVIKYKVL